VQNKILVDKLQIYLFKVDAEIIALYSILSHIAHVAPI